jgi:hypothetical protein
MSRPFHPVHVALFPLEFGRWTASFNRRNAVTKFKALTATIAVVAFVSSQVAMAANPSPKAWNATWHLNIGQSKFGSPETTEKSETRKYYVAGNHVTMRSNEVTGDGRSMHWGYGASTDAHWYLTSGNPAFDHIALTAPNGREMKAETRKNKEPTGRATLTVSADGKHLTMERSNGKADDTLVFDRAK